MHKLNYFISYVSSDTLTIRNGLQWSNMDQIHCHLSVSCLSSAAIQLNTSAPTTNDFYQNIGIVIFPPFHHYELICIHVMIVVIIDLSPTVWHWLVYIFTYADISHPICQTVIHLLFVHATNTYIVLYSQYLAIHSSN